MHFKSLNLSEHPFCKPSKGTYCNWGSPEDGRQLSLPATKLLPLANLPVEGWGKVGGECLQYTDWVDQGREHGQTPDRVVPTIH